MLVLNKIDRLILELNLTPLDAYIHLTQVLEQVSVFCFKCMIKVISSPSLNLLHLDKCCSWRTFQK